MWIECSNGKNGLYVVKVLFPAIFAKFGVQIPKLLRGLKCFLYEIDHITVGIKNDNFTLLLKIILAFLIKCT